MADQGVPMDLVMEVLIRLPVKSIIKSMSVSKTWHDLIRSRAFINAHQKLEGKKKTLLVKGYSFPGDGNGELFSFSDVWIQLDDSIGHLHILRQSFPSQRGEGGVVSFNFQEFPHLWFSRNLSIPNRTKTRWQKQSSIPIHGPCNGLVCIVFHKSVFLCNPALREFKQLPYPRFPVGYIFFPFQHGFGFDPITGAYKVIQISEMSNLYQVPNPAVLWGRPSMNRLRIDLYNSASNSWKQIHCKELPTLSYLPGYELLYNGVIHWAIVNAPYDAPCILCFDVSSETFRQLHLHDDFLLFENELRLMEMDQSLAVVRYPRPMMAARQMEIWVMKEYGVKESWTKQFVIAPGCDDICPFSLLKNEGLQVEFEDGSSDELHGEHFKGFHFYGTHPLMTTVFYEESLISLNQIIAT